MIIIVENILHNVIASKLKGSAIYLEDERRHDLVMESLIVFIEKYTNNPNFKIKNSFITYLQRMVLNPLYHPKKKLREKMETSINTPIGSNGDGSINLGDLLEVVSGMFGSEEYVLNTFQKELQLDAISYLLDNLFIQVTRNYDVKTAIIVLKSIYLELDPKVTDEDIIGYWGAFSNEIHTISNYSMKVLYDFVKDEIANVDGVMSYEDYIEKFGEEEPSENEDLENNTILVEDEDLENYESLEELGEYI